MNLTPEYVCDDGVSIMWMLDTEYGIDYEVEFEIPFLEKENLNPPFPLGFKK